MEPLFGSAPLWGAIPTSPGWSPQVGRIAGVAIPAPSQIRMTADALGYGSGAVPAAAPVPSFGAAELVAPTTALVAAVATRRGQPNGPVTDAEIEDFLNDALDLVSGTSDVEVRCEGGGRVLLTGNVPHKRHKRDIGEIAWAIPSVTDVQNNAAIVARRRARASGHVRENEAQSGPVRKHA